MLAIIAAVLVVLWLLGFLAFHVSSGLIHSIDLRSHFYHCAFLPWQRQHSLAVAV